MKSGKLQQIGKPQDIYDDPINLFVAKFLGTPPINVFNGKMAGGKLYIGDEIVAEIDQKNESDRDVYIAIRPEGFDPREGGRFHCDLTRIEVMGRDISVVCTNPELIGESVRAIIDSEELPAATLSGEPSAFVNTIGSEAPPFFHLISS